MIHISKILLTDVFWVGAILAMSYFISRMAQMHLRPSAARWFGLLVFVSCINIVGVILTDTIGHEYPLGLRAISIGRAFIPYCMLIFSLVFPFRRPITNFRPGLFLLAIPSLVTVAVTDPMFAPGDISYQLKYHIPWMGAYFLWSYINLILSSRRLRLPSTKRQHLVLTLAVVPATAMHYTTSILLPAIGRDHIWRYNWIPILLSALVIFVGFLRFGSLKRHATINRSLLDQSIDVAGMSVQIITHAVKNSLQVIRSLAETAAASSCPDRETRIDRIKSLCDELADRMNKLNTLTHPSLGLALAMVDIRLPLEKALARAEPRMTSIKLERDYARALPKVLADQMHLEEIFFNLIINAVEAMPTGGTLRLETRAENDWVLAAVHDQGIGIHPDQLVHIFEPFHTTKRPGQNWGIGLTYCHMIMERLSGDLYAESFPGKGSTFYVILPLSSFPHAVSKAIAHQSIQ